MKRSFLNNLKKVEALACGSKIDRFVSSPIKYVPSIFYREINYKISKKGRLKTCKTFFDAEITVELPAGMDIYLTGGKSHSSEIRLAKYLIKNLESSNTFIDIGAHFGYFSLLASILIGQEGTVHSFEASPKTYSVLESIKSNHKNIRTYNEAVCDKIAKVVFHEFPPNYSEYNSLNAGQYKGEKWYHKNTPKETQVNSIVMDEFLTKNSVSPNIIKIDVEGAEYKVLLGMKNYLKVAAPEIVMEHLCENRFNEEHRKADKLLKQFGYIPYTIKFDGSIKRLHTTVDNYLKEVKLESDNIMYKKYAS